LRGGDVSLPEDEIARGVAVRLMDEVNAVLPSRNVVAAGGTLGAAGGA
jgi:hypothetical protein